MAGADGFAGTISNPGVLPIGLVLKAAGPSAQATLNSLGTSGAFSSFPDFGDVQSFPGLVGSLFGVPLPPAPNYIRTQAGDKPTDRTAPGVSLHAESGDSVAQAITVAGSGSTGYTTTARVERRADDSVSSSSRALANGLDLLGVLRLSVVDSQATASRDPAGLLATASSLSVSSIVVPGLAVTVPRCTPATIPIPVPVAGAPPIPPLTLQPLCTPDSLASAIGQGPLPIPAVAFQDGFFTTTIPAFGSQKMAVPATDVLKALATNGITMTYQQPQELLDKNRKPDGILAPVLSFTVSGELPAPLNRLAPGTSTVTVQFGSATASVNYAVASDASIEPADANSPPAGNQELGGAAAVTSSDGTGLPPTMAGVGGVTGVPAPSRAGLQLSAGRTPGSGAATTLDLSSIYLLAAAGSLLAFGAGHAVRLLGVLRWNS
jgi:hypothetical protein